MNVKLISLLETLESMTSDQVQALTPELRELRKQVIFELQKKLLKSIESNMTVNEKDDHFWKDLGKTFLGL